MSVLGVILARAGSKGVPNKHLILLNGRPLISYTIDFALKEKTIDAVILSTDGEKIAAVGSKLGVPILMRPPEYATDDAPIDLALRHAVRDTENTSSRMVEIVIVLYGSVPIRKPGIVDQAVETIRATGADSVETFTEYQKHPLRAFRIESDRPAPMSGARVPGFYRRQNLTPAYYPDGAVAAIRRDVLMATENIPGESGEYFGKDRRAIIQAPTDTTDIDEPIDLLWTEFLMNYSRKSDSSNRS